VELFALHKPPGAAPRTHLDLWRLLRRLRPAILHTYNLGCYEYSATALAAGVPVRIHAEHGRDAGDPQGLNRKHNLLRRLVAPCIDRIVPVSRDLHDWLRDTVGIDRAKLALIDNGVDTERFRPADPGNGETALEPWQDDPAAFVIGTVGRLQDVKDQATLVAAFTLLRTILPQAAGLQDCVWMAGPRADVAPPMRGFSLFALSSIAEGTPVTLLEAMASGLPVVASAVGGIPDLVQDGAMGTLVPARDPQRLAEALAAYVRDPALAAAHGAAGRAHVERRYSMRAMLDSYIALYDGLCRAKMKTNKAITPCAE